MERIANIPPVVPGIFTLPPYDQIQPKLLGGFCPTCNRYYFPRPRYCRGCLGQTEEVPLASEGVIYSFTVIRRKPPLGLPEPYGVGYVDLEKSGLRVFSLLDPTAIGRLKIGLKVRLVVEELGHDGHGAPRLRPYFTPITRP